MTMIQEAVTAKTTPILSIDLGRTSTKVCINRDPDSVILIPGNVAHLTVEQVRKGMFDPHLSDPLLDIWLEYQGKGYAMGQLAADFGADLGIGQSKLEDALLRVLVAIGYFELKDDLAVILGLPYENQEKFDREKEEIKNLLKSPHSMLYRGEQFSVNIKEVWVVPEGYGSLIWMEAIQKNAKQSGLFNSSVAIVDIGHQTTDFIMVDKFRFARGVSKSELFGMGKFYEQVASQIQGADSQSLLLIEAVNRPEGERFYRPKGAKKPTDLDEILPSLRKSFARELCDRLLAWLPERATDVIVTGGGGEFFWSDFEQLLNEAQLRVSLTQPSRKANALGQYIYGEVRLSSSR